MQKQKNTCKNDSRLPVRNYATQRTDECPCSSVKNPFCPRNSIPSKISSTNEGNTDFFEQKLE